MNIGTRLLIKLRSWVGSNPTVECKFNELQGEAKLVNYLFICVSRISLLIQTYKGGVMPIYHYHCQKCDFKLVDNRPIGEEAKPICGNCKTEMQRSFGVQTIIFKGNGWGKDR